MASPSTYNRKLNAAPQRGTDAPRPAAPGDGGVPHAERIPLYVGIILLVSAGTLLGLHKMKFRMIVGAG